MTADETKAVQVMGSAIKEFIAPSINAHRVAMELKFALFDKGFEIVKVEKKVRKNSDHAGVGKPAGVEKVNHT